MGYVTEVVLIVDYEDTISHNGKESKVDILNRVCKGLNPVDEYAGGGKGFESGVFLGAINYLDEKALIDSFCSIKWSEPRATLLILKDDCDEEHCVYTPK